VDKARILIGLPAFHGAAHIAETLRSIQQQTFRAFRVIISVDDGDKKTAQICEPFLADSRFSLVVQERRLGWNGNINWLMAQEDYEYFCYWQQDDLTSPDYLSALVDCADKNPSVACSYSDIQWFGMDHTRVVCPSVSGFSLSRALYFLETMNGVPFRGLIRRDAIGRVGPIRSTVFEGALEEFVWLAKLAREGSLRRVEGPLYFKRRHSEALSVKWDSRGDSWKRAVWIEFGLGMLEAIWPVVPGGELETAVSMLLDRLCCPKDSRHLFYDPSAEAETFGADFVTQARQRFPFPESVGLRISDPNFIRGAVCPAIARHTAFLDYLDELGRQLVRDGSLDLTFGSAAAGTVLLLSGWSTPEPWGVWSDGPSARLQLPIPVDNGPWQIRFTCRSFADRARMQKIVVGINNLSCLAQWRFSTNRVLSEELLIEPQSQRITVHFQCPDAIAPSVRGSSGDSRRLGLGLLQAKISRPRTKWRSQLYRAMRFSS